jgi:hypothetical protein
MEIGDIPSSMPDLRGPSFSQWDLTIMKDFRLRERSTLQLRCEASNLLNHVNAGMPDSDLTRGTFGVIQRVNGSSRTITVAAKLSF